MDTGTSTFNGKRQNKIILQMLCLYLYTLIIGHKSCNMLSILNKIIVQKKLQNFVTHNVFLDKKVKTHQNKKSNIETLAVARN